MLNQSTIKNKLVAYVALKRHGGRAGWAADLAQYFWRNTNRPVGKRTIIRNIDAYNDRASERIEAITNQMISGKKKLPQWQKEMGVILKDTWRTNYMTGRGGRDVMTFSDWGRVGGRLRYQYDKLNNFAQEIAAGNLTPAQVSARAELYARAPWQAFQEGGREANKTAGYTEERRNEVMDKATCAGCAHWHAQGWQPIGTLPPPGSECDCGANCRGEFEFRGKLTKG